MDDKSRLKALETENARLQNELAAAKRKADEAETAAWAQSLQPEISKYDEP